MEIKILWTGCPSCKKLEENVKKALEKKWTDAEVVKVQDIVDIMSYNVMSMPALVVDEELKFFWKIPSPQEIIEMLNL